jgi:2-O-(6-phospho-alpha-D-mannosyl)-D-glycerate hydrolase
VRLPEAQCLGTYRFDYSIIPHEGTWENAYRDAYDFKHPMKTVLGRRLEQESLTDYSDRTAGIELPVSHSFVEVDGTEIVVSAIKKQETRDSLIVRLFNFGSNAAIGNVRINIPGKRIGNAFVTNLREERQHSVDVEAAGDIRVEIRSKGLLTLELLLRQD